MPEPVTYSIIIYETVDPSVIAYLFEAIFCAPQDFPYAFSLDQATLTDKDTFTHELEFDITVKQTRRTIIVDHLNILAALQRLAAIAPHMFASIVDCAPTTEACQSFLVALLSTRV